MDHSPNEAPTLVPNVKISTKPHVTCVLKAVEWADEEIKTIDTNRCKVSLLTGEYDYSATPEMSQAAADAITGSRLTIMKDIGHFPMIENYERFRPYLLAELEQMV